MERLFKVNRVQYFDFIGFVYNFPVLIAYCFRYFVPALVFEGLAVLSEYRSDLRSAAL